jgi:hypothetical protein
VIREQFLSQGLVVPAPPLEKPEPFPNSLPLTPPTRYLSPPEPTVPTPGALPQLESEPLCTPLALQGKKAMDAQVFLGPSSPGQHRARLEMAKPERLGHQRYMQPADGQGSWAEPPCPFHQRSFSTTVSWMPGVQNRVRHCYGPGIPVYWRT